MKRTRRFYTYDAVSVVIQGKRQFGWITDLYGRKASVELENGGLYRIALSALKRRGLNKRRLLDTETELSRFLFLPKDSVKFEHKGQEVIGTISHLAKIRASVCLSSSEVLGIPYALLRFARDHSTQIQVRREKLKSLARRSVAELQKHRLSDWIFRFDHSVSRAGVCKYPNKLIAVSSIHCLMHHEEEVWDTVLHEITHALVGVEHQHDEEWSRVAKSIGCSASVRSGERLERTRYIQTCTTCGWGRRLQRRVRNRQCGICGTPITYKPFTEEEWIAMRRLSIDPNR